MLSRCISLLLAVFAWQSSSAQTATQDQEIDEVVVTGEQSLRLMRLQTEKLQDAAFDVFNETYAGTDYELVCKRERPIKEDNDVVPVYGTVRICGSRYNFAQRDKAADDLFEEHQGYGFQDTVYYDEVFELHRADLIEKFAEMVKENPEFLKRLSEYAGAKSRYEAARKADLEDGNFFTKMFRSRNKD